jgi:TMEM175 potassium channel family protein
MTEAHANTRLEALCDGVFAIAMTLLIIDIKLPEPENIGVSELWRALRHLTPAVFAFVLSFTIIFIDWVNHHATMRLVRHSTPSFIYANGFLLLTVVAMPFPSSLLGAFLWTDQAAPAVALYNAVLVAQAAGWILVLGTALASHITVDERATAALRTNRRHAYFALIFYAVLAVTALWFPLTMAMVSALSWLFWLVLGVRMKHA